MKKSKILITGGTGFLGRRLGKILLNAGYSVILCGRSNKQNLEASTFSGCQTLAMDVSSIESVRDIVTQVQPRIIIHAAATKFVDIAEEQPMEAVDINVIGSQNVARVAIEKSVELVIGISTDKASPPVRNTYGLTKALMERMFCAMDNKSKTQFLCVRYGNVAWSTGSVLPIWYRMLQENGTIGTTGPDMVRFFFSVDEAVELILVALHHRQSLHGKVLSCQMKSARMEDVARTWLSLHGGRYVLLPTRPGDREEEYLIGELELPFTMEKYFHGIPHYIISFNKKVKKPLTNIISSGSAERLSTEEIVRMIESRPVEEIGQGERG